MTTMNVFLTPTETFPQYMMFPKFLLHNAKCNSTTKLVYMVLFDRARISMQNADWIDSNGHVFLNYTLKNLAKTMKKNESTIRNSLDTLEIMGLIERKRQGFGRPNRIYVKFPKESKTQPPIIFEKERNSSCDEIGENSDLQTNKNEENRKNATYNTYGNYQNVFITDEEMADLQNSIPNIEEYIERLSNYMKSKNKNYPNHAATIKLWYARDADKKSTTTAVNREYNDKEYDGL